MKSDVSMERLTHNEAVFRKENEKVSRRMQAIVTPDVPIRFVCECANLDCTERVWLTARQFSQLHKSKRLYVIKPGHEKPAIEHIVKENEDYVLVEKYIDPDI
jgi:hypothetical protein